MRRVGYDGQHEPQDVLYRSASFLEANERDPSYVFTVAGLLLYVLLVAGVIALLAT